MRLTRRLFVSGAACTCSAGLGGFVASAQQVIPSSQGCFLNASRADEGYDQVISRGIARQTFFQTTGDKQFDKQLGRAIIRLSGFFGEQPAFGIVDGREHDNAFALPRAGTKAEYGTVGVGRTLLKRLKEEDASGMSILALVAHEFGHVAQFRRGTIAELNAGQTTVRRSELHADFLTGCYLGWRKRNEPRVRVLTAGRFMESIGDDAVSSKDHHGTPEERLRATEEGFALAFDTAKPFDTYFETGKNFVLNNF